MSFGDNLDLSLVVTGLVDTGETDGGGNPIYTTTTKGTVDGRIDPITRPTEVNGPDLNPVIAEYLAITALASGFSIVESDTLTGDDGVYEVLGVHTLHKRSGPHHHEINLRKITA